MHVCGGWRGYAELRIEALFAFKAEGALKKKFFQNPQII
jgi:hypothetical protein